MLLLLFGTKLVKIFVISKHKCENIVKCNVFVAVFQSSSWKTTINQHIVRLRSATGLSSFVRLSCLCAFAGVMSVKCHPICPLTLSCTDGNARNSLSLTRKIRLPGSLWLSCVPTLTILEAHSYCFAPSFVLSCSPIHACRTSKTIPFAPKKMVFSVPFASCLWLGNLYLSDT